MIPNKSLTEIELNENRIETLNDFFDIVGGEKQSVDGFSDWELYESWVISRDEWDQSLTITVSSTHGDEYTLSISTDTFTGRYPTEAPLSKWNITQSLDDNNLRTGLEVQSKTGISAGIAVYGPAIEGTTDGEITLLNSNEENYLL